MASTLQVDGALTVSGATNALSPIAVRNATQSFNGGLSAEVNTSILNFGLNEGSGNRFGGSYTQANQGGMMHFDTRDGEPLFQLYGRTAGTANASGSVLFQIDSTGNTVFNEGGVDADFRVESDDNTHMLFVNAANDVVCVGANASDTFYALNVTGAGTVLATVESTADTDTYGGFAIARNHKGNGQGHGLSFLMDNAGSNMHEFAYVGVVIEDGTTGSEDGYLSFRTTTAGTERNEVVRVTGVHQETVAGAVGSPSYSFIGDSDTGMSRPTTNVVNLCTNGSERLRVDALGRLLIGHTAAVGGHSELFGIDCGASSNFGMFISGNSSGGTVTAVRFYDSGASAGVVGSITMSTDATSFNTSSDARLKDVTGAARGLEVINELNPVAYNWKKTGQAGEGLIAQEVLDLVPNAVHQSTDDEMYSMDYSKLVVHLVKAVQEQQTQIDALQSEINLLKGE